jgi:hypothetical protein
MARQFSLPGLEAPNTALYVSALVKSIRLRRTEDAITWLLTLWRYPTLRHRITRRVLISSGEDSISPELIGAVAGWYNGPHRQSFPHAAREVCRICGTPSWWAVQAGHDMILSWKRAESIAERVQTSSLDATLVLLDRAIARKNLLGGLGIFMRASLLRDFSNVGLVSALSPWVEQLNNERVAKLFDGWRQVAPVLGRDTNISGLLVFLLLGGRLPVVSLPDIKDPRVRLIANFPQCVQLTANGVGAATELPQPPAWANDGIHARGDGPIDRRFAGVLSNFVAMCRAYDFYGRLDPSDPWFPEFYSCDA